MMEMVKGFKALSKYMKAIYGNSMGYRLNKWYKMRSNIKIKPCERGYHFFNNIKDIFRLLFCEEEYDIYETEAKGNIVKDKDFRYNGKYVCSEIKIVRKLSKEEINKYIEDNLKELISDEDWRVRCEVARQRCGLDILVNDEHWAVRYEVAKQGYGLDILVNDADPDVRREVARQGYGLDILVNDEHWAVRRKVARQGYGLDILVNDKEWVVRREVARQGYGLDILVNDDDCDVRREVQLKLRNN